MHGLGSHLAAASEGDLVRLAMSDTLQHRRAMTSSLLDSALEMAAMFLQPCARRDWKSHFGPTKNRGHREPSAGAG